MKSVILIFLSSVCLLFNLVNAADCISCLRCFHQNKPVQDGQSMLAISRSDDCYNYKDFSLFEVYAGNNFHGCGYADNINTLYNKCANECSTCQKTDRKCATALDRPSAHIRCTSTPCAKRGEKLGLGRVCCDGLDSLEDICIDPNQDCTSCGHQVEGNKPCCDRTGLNINGIWKCGSSVAGCRTCNVDSNCSGSKRCVANCCN